MAHMRSCLAVVFILLGGPIMTFAQIPRVQQLLSKLDTARGTVDREHLYYALSRYYWDKDADSALLLGRQSLEIATKIGDDTATALAYLTMGVALDGKGDYPGALGCHLKALRFSEKAGMEGLSGNNFTNIGIVYADMGE